MYYCNLECISIISVGGIKYNYVGVVAPHVECLAGPSQTVGTEAEPTRHAALGPPRFMCGHVQTA